MVEAPLCSKKVRISASLKIQWFISILFRLEADNQLYVKYKVRCDKSVLSFSKQKSNWLPRIKRRDLALLKIIHKALYDDVWPDYLRLKFHTVSADSLRSLEAPKLAIPTESGTFQDWAARLFNMLPDKLRQEPDSTDVYPGRLRPDVQPLTLLYTILHHFPWKRYLCTSSIYLLLTNGTPFTYLV